MSEHGSEIAPLKNGRSVPFHTSSIKSIKDCNKTQTIRLMEHCLDQMNNKKLNKVKKELINYFDLRNINGQQFGRMDSKQFSKSIIDHLGDEHKSLMNILRKLYIKMITFEFDAIDIANSKKLRCRKQSVFNNENNQISDFDSERMAQLLKNDILTNDKNEKLLKYKEEIIEYFIEFNVSGETFNAMKAKEFVTNLRKHLKIKNAKLRPALRALHESIKSYHNIQMHKEHIYENEEAALSLDEHSGHDPNMSGFIMVKQNKEKLGRQRRTATTKLFRGKFKRKSRTNAIEESKTCDFSELFEQLGQSKNEKKAHNDYRLNVYVDIEEEEKIYRKPPTLSNEQSDDDSENEYPVYLNVAIFGKSEDEALEKLIDRAVLDVCYQSEFEKLWDSKKFIDCVYSDVLFPNALNKVFETINDTVYNEYGFIGNFINTHFEEEIDEYLMKLNKKEEAERKSNVDFEDFEETKFVVLRNLNKETQIANFKIAPKQRQNNYLMEFSAENAFDANYSWAVFKRRKLSRDFAKDEVMKGAKGYWNVLEDGDYTGSGKSVHGKAQMSHWIKQVTQLKLDVDSPSEGGDFSSSTSTFNTSVHRSRFQLIPLWHLNILFEFMVHQRASCQYQYRMNQDTISIGPDKYTLVFWNEMERTKCNSFIIKIGEDQRQFYYIRYRHQLDNLRWCWYDNDNNKYRSFQHGDNNAIIKELEACYYGNLQVNFPQKLRDARHKTLFRCCHLLELKKHTMSGQHYVLRFTVNDKPPFRIANMEQCACSKNKRSFPRNVRRLINGRNTIDFDGQKTNDYIEEWKKRYLLQTLQQQKYFFSYILSISAVIKYIEIELSYQIISSSGEKKEDDDDELFSSLNDSHIRKQRMDFEMSSGFFIPPKLDIEMDVDGDKDKETLYSMNDMYGDGCVSVGHLKKVDAGQFDDIEQGGCSHNVGNHGHLWGFDDDRSAAYCDDCAQLILFSEYIKKYVLESENDDACDQLWPWHRNYFRRQDCTKEQYYFKNISKHNLSGMYEIDKCLWTQPQTSQYWLFQSSANIVQSKVKEDRYENIQIRHNRKFAAHFLLNGCNIERNLNILRMQLAWIVKYSEIKSMNAPDGTWEEWKLFIHKCNDYISKKYEDSASIRHDFGDEEKVKMYKEMMISLFDAIAQDSKYNLYNSFNSSIDNSLKPEQQPEYFSHFMSMWTSVPFWWRELKSRSIALGSCYNYDHLLLQLALVYNLDIDRYAESLKNDPMDKLGFTQFLEWIKDWRNVQHRLRYLTFIICKYLKQCKLNIEDLKLDSKYQISQYKSRSIIFLNGYMHHVHKNNCGSEQSEEFEDALVKSKQQEFRDRHLDTNRKKDPFINRKLDFELAQVFRSLNVCKYGMHFAESILKVLRDNPRPTLWTALEMLVEILPFKITKTVLIKHRYLLVLQPLQRTMELANAMLRSTSCTVEVCLFLTTYMQQNAKIDINRHEEWLEVADNFNEESTKVLSSIESELLLLLYVTMPRYQISDQPLFNTALKTKCTQFFNNPKITTSINHIWESASPHNPHRGIAFTFQQMSMFDKLCYVADKPFNYFLSPMGFDASSKLAHFLYLITIYSFIAIRVYLTDPIELFEWIVWSFNFGFIVNEFIECHSKGITEYFAVFGWVNVWDILISIVWIICFGIRMFSVTNNYKDYSDLNGVYVLLWGMQAASLSVRSLAWFQTSPYSGSLLRIIVGLYREIVRFLLILSLFLLGYVFGLYYIDGGYEDKSGLSIFDWYEHFKYMFQLTLAMQQIPDTDIAIQIFIMTYVFCGTILLLNLLIAIMTKAFEHLDEKTSMEISYTKAEAAMEMSYKSRFLPAPFCVFVFVISAIIHIGNFIPAMINPAYNVHKYIHQTHYHTFYNWRCKSCFRRDKAYGKTVSRRKKRLTRRFDRSQFIDLRVSIDDDDDEDLTSDQYRIVTRRRILRYYLSTLFCCCSKTFGADTFVMYHQSCYAPMLTRRGAKQKPMDRDVFSIYGMSIEEYLDKHDKKADKDDLNLLNTFGTGSMFCWHCYRPFHPKDVHKQLISPFWAMAEIISVYSFIIFLYVPLLIAYLLGSILENLNEPTITTFDPTLDVSDNSHEYYNTYHQDTNFISSRKKR